MAILGLKNKGCAQICSIQGGPFDLRAVKFYRGFGLWISKKFKASWNNPRLRHGRAILPYLNSQFSTTKITCSKMTNLMSCNSQNIYHFIYWGDKFCMQKMCYLKLSPAPPPPPPFCLNPPPPPPWQWPHLETKGVKNPGYDAFNRKIGTFLTFPLVMMIETASNFTEIQIQYSKV